MLQLQQLPTAIATVYRLWNMIQSFSHNDQTVCQLYYVRYHKTNPAYILLFIMFIVSVIYPSILINLSILSNFQIS